MITGKAKTTHCEKHSNLSKLTLSMRKFTQIFHAFFSSKSNDTQPQLEYLTEVIMPHDATSKNFTDAIKKEIVGLSCQNTWELISAKRVVENATVLYGRFVLEIRDEITFNEICKARLLSQGNKDLMKASLVRSISIACQYFIKFIDSLAVIFLFPIFSTDVTRAYLQSKEKLQRDMYVILLQIIWTQ